MVGSPFAPLFQEAQDLPNVQANNTYRNLLQQTYAAYHQIEREEVGGTPPDDVAESTAQSGSVDFGNHGGTGAPGVTDAIPQQAVPLEGNVVETPAAPIQGVDFRDPDSVWATLPERERYNLWRAVVDAAELGGVSTGIYPPEQAGEVITPEPPSVTDGAAQLPERSAPEDVPGAQQATSAATLPTPRES